MVKLKVPYRDVYGKTVIQLIRGRIIRFLVNLLIVLVSISLTAGIGALSSSYVPAFISNYKNGNAPDVILKYVPDETEKQTNTLWTDEKINQVKNTKGVKHVTSVVSLDQEDKNHENENCRLLFYQDFNEAEGVGLPKLNQGEYPSSAFVAHEESFMVDVLIMEDIHGLTNHQIGDIVPVSFSFMDVPMDIYLHIIGTATQSLYNSKQKERAMSEEEYYLNNIYFTSIDVFGAYKAMFPITDLYVSLSHNHQLMSDEYYREINEYKKTFENDFTGHIQVLTLEENTSYSLYKSYTKKIDIISYIIPFFFIAVCALVVMIIISRLIADERSTIACYSSLGIPKRRIYGKYLLFSILSSSIGIIVGYFLGSWLLPLIIYPAYKAVFRIPYLVTSWLSPIGIITAVLIISSCLIVTLSAVRFCLRETPAELMKAKAPKAGKQILLEKWKKLWGVLSFSFKSSVRNIFRHKKNLSLTTLSIIGSTVLIFLGMGLSNSAEAMKSDPLFENVASSIGFISMVIVLYGIAISSLVIYALSSMNIDERVREIAVLKVLGYTDMECALFIFREILMITIVAGLLGIPVSMGAAQVAFTFLGFGSLKSIQWTTYVFTYVIILVSSLISCLLLYKKIKKVDYNISLKSVE